MYKKKIWIQQENLYKINFPATTTKMTQPHNCIVHYKPIGATPQRHFFRGEGGAWYEKGVTLRGLRISEKKEILSKLTVFNDGSNLNCHSSLLRHLASIGGPSLLIVEL